MGKSIDLWVQSMIAAKKNNPSRLEPYFLFGVWLRSTHESSILVISYLVINCTMRPCPWVSLFLLSCQLVFSAPDNTDPIEDTTDLFTMDSSFMDQMPIDNSDLSLPTFFQDSDQFHASFADLTAAEGKSCPVGKKRDGPSCGATPTLETPSLLDIFGIGDGSDKTGSDSIPDADIWDRNNFDPCTSKAPYIHHLCCYGSLGPPFGLYYQYIDACIPGASSSILRLWPYKDHMKTEIAASLLPSLAGLTHVCMSPYDGCCQYFDLDPNVGPLEERFSCRCKTHQ